MPTMRAERGGSSGEVGPLKATVAPPATEQEQEVMRPPSEIKWAEVREENRLSVCEVVGVDTRCSRKVACSLHPSNTQRLGLTRTHRNSPP